ncbi:hypothetical protein KQX54_008164, partial [Cotesia glomerata]
MLQDPRRHRSASFTCLPSSNYITPATATNLRSDAALLCSGEVIGLIARQKYNPFVSLAQVVRCTEHVNSCLYLFRVT